MDRILESTVVIFKLQGEEAMIQYDKLPWFCFFWGYLAVQGRGGTNGTLLLYDQEILYKKRLNDTESSSDPKEESRV